MVFSKILWKKYYAYKWKMEKVVECAQREQRIVKIKRSRENSEQFWWEERKYFGKVWRELMHLQQLFTGI